MAEINWRQMPEAQWGGCTEFRVLRAIVADTLAADASEGMIRSGMIEETFELLSPLANEERNDVVKEVGDNLWYHETARKALCRDTGWPTEAVQLNCYQRYNQTMSLPIVSPSGATLNPQTDRRGALAIATLRVVDTMNPKNDELWRGVEKEHKRNAAAVLHDHLAALGSFALGEDIDFSQATKALASKHSTRRRKPHVVDANPTDSLRERLVPVSPWVLEMIQTTAVENLGSGGQLLEKMIR
ncbi:MAG: hypothetical protein WBO35_05735 [Candidatus Saccharimonadales bacterium]